MAAFDSRFGAGSALEGLALRVLQDAPVVILVLDLQGRIKHVNPFFERLTGYRLDEALDRDWFETFLPERDRAEHRALFARSAGGAHVRDHVNALVTRGGEERQIEWTDEFLRADDGLPGAILAIGRDVTEHQRAELELRANEERLRILIESTPAGVAMLDRDLRYIACSRRWITDYHLEGKEFLGRSHYEVFPEIPERWRAIHRRCLTGLSDRCDEDRFERADGSVQFLRWAIEPWRDPGGAVGGVIFFTEDITEHKRAELELRANEERLRILIESTPAGVAMLDRELRYIACSRRWITDYQLEGKELLGRSHYEVFPDLPGRWKEIHRRCLTGLSQRCDEDRFERADGSVHYERWAIEPWRDPSGGVGGLIVFTEDITERKRLEEQRARLEGQLQQAQKMESLGRLAGGIAHDFNNLLGVVAANVELASAAVSAAEPVRGFLDDIATACSRASDLVKQILAFSGQQSTRRVVTSLGPVAEEVARLLRARLPAGIQVDLRVGQDVPLVRSDPSQLHQVLMNLGMNAWQAIYRPTGTITFRVAAATVDAAAPPAAGLAPGRYARLQVEDDGAGMPPDVVEHIFEPFFSTRGLGRGTGLGLAVVHGIVTEHGGGIEVETAPGRGSTFSVFLPETAPEPAAPVTPPQPRRGAGRVLLIDDEALLIRVTTQLLERLGYEVAGFVRAADALAALRADPSRFDVVLTDQHMPELEGHEVARAVFAIRPGLPVVLVSGNRIYTDEQLAAVNIRWCLNKPFSTAELSAVLARALGLDG